MTAPHRRCAPGRFFRVLVFVAALLHVILWLSPLAGPHWLAMYDVWLLDFDGYGAAIDYHPVLYWTLLASWLLMLAGLFFYVSAARVGMIALVALSIALSLAWGIRVLTPLEAALGAMLAVVDGALIAMAYCRPVGAEFERPR